MVAIFHNFPDLRHFKMIDVEFDQCLLLMILQVLHFLSEGWVSRLFMYSQIKAKLTVFSTKANDVFPVKV